MSLRSFLVTMFPYAKTSYSITRIEDIKRILYSDRDKGTVYQGSQAAHYGFKKAAPYTGIYDRLAERIWKYLNNPSVETMESFDNWHADTCKEFCRDCNGHGILIEYGLAQKFLNLALKYCYCFDDAYTAESKDKFTFCHVALDGYTFCPSTSSRNCAYYRRYCRMSRAGLARPFYTEVVDPVADIKALPAWSKLSAAQYNKVQNDMRRYFSAAPITYATVLAHDAHHLAGCSGSTILTPFQSEFFLW